MHCCVTIMLKQIQAYFSKHTKTKFISELKSIFFCVSQVILIKSIITPVQGFILSQKTLAHIKLNQRFTIYNSFTISFQQQFKTSSCCFANISSFYAFTSIRNPYFHKWWNGKNSIIIPQQIVPLIINKVKSCAYCSKDCHGQTLVLKFDKHYNRIHKTMQKTSLTIIH